MRLRFSTVLFFWLTAAAFLFSDSTEQSLQDLIATGNVDGVRQLLETHPELANAAIPIDIKGSPDASISGLCFALWHEQPQIAELLLQNGADPTRNILSRTPLHYAASGGYTELIPLLIQKGDNPNRTDNTGRMPLVLAKDAQTAEVLLNYGADVNARNDNGQQTPLHLLSDSGSLEVAAVLIEHGADVNAADETGNTPLHAASRFCRLEQIRFLLDNGADVHVTGRFNDPALHLAAYAGNPKTVELLLAAGVDVNALGVHGELPLHWVSKLPNADPYRRECHYDRITQLLLDAGSQLNVGARQAWIGIGHGVSGNEPIDQVFYYLRNLQVQRASQQVQVAAVPDLAFDVGDTPLHSAARWGRLEIVNMLIDAGAEVNAANALNQTPLHYAVVYQHPEVVKSLLAAGADPSIKTNKDLNAFEFAEIIADPEILSLLAVKEKWFNSQKVGNLRCFLTWIYRS